tara:strand:- start:119 stop:712 length:594 start_codon:yes stop_codon:yes gene_type:complete
MSFQKNKDFFVHKLFPTSILEIENFIDKQECKDILNKIKQNKKYLKKHLSLLGDASTTYLEQNFLSKLNPLIKSSLLEVTKKYSEMTGFEIENKFAGSWFNIQKKNSALKKHNHPMSIISGILYIQCDKDSFNTHFHNPNPMLTFTKINKDTEFSVDWVAFKPKVGTLLLFPSWLLHGSNLITNKCNQRIVISFNII